MLQVFLCVSNRYRYVSYALHLCGNLGDRFVWQREYMETDVALKAAVIVTVVTEV